MLCGLHAFDNMTITVSQKKEVKIEKVGCDFMRQRSLK